MFAPTQPLTPTTTRNSLRLSQVQSHAWNLILSEGAEAGSVEAFGRRSPGVLDLNAPSEDGEAMQSLPPSPEAPSACTPLHHGTTFFRSSTPTRLTLPLPCFSGAKIGGLVGSRTTPTPTPTPPPLTRTLPPPSSSSSTSHSSPSSPGPLFLRNVLVVDDDAICRKMMSMSLRRLRCNVFQAIDGSDCLARVEAAGHDFFDAIFMDGSMQPMHGVKATEELTRRNVRAPVIAVTANESAKDHAAFLQAGAKQVHTKPLSLAQLQAILATLFHTTAADVVQPN